MDFNRLTLGNSPRELITAGSICLGLLFIVWGVRTVVRRKLRNAASTPGQTDDFFLGLANQTKLFLLFLPAVFLGARVLDLPSDLRGHLKTVASISIIAQTALWVGGVIDFWLRRYHKTRLDSDPASATTIAAFRTGAVVLVWAIAVLEALTRLGFEVRTLIAGLGIGGVAIALATQNILADLFASLSIVLDKPFVVGDPITVDSHSGTVEHIGLKTTRLRSVNGEQLVFSNNDLLKSRIQNWKRMAERRSYSRLGVTYQTPPELLERIPMLLRAAAEKQERVRFDRAHFVRFGDSAYEFELAFFALVSDYAEYLTIQQAVYLDIIKAFEAEGVEFAYPTRTVLVQQVADRDR